MIAYHRVFVISNFIEGFLSILFSLRIQHLLLRAHKVSFHTTVVLFAIFIEVSYFYFVSHLWNS